MLKTITVTIRNIYPAQIDTIFEFNLIILLQIEGGGAGVEVEKGWKPIKKLARIVLIIGASWI